MNLAMYRTVWFIFFMVSTTLLFGALSATIQPIGLVNAAWLHGLFAVIPAVGVVGSIIGFVRTYTGNADTNN